MVEVGAVVSLGDGYGVVTHVRGRDAYLAPVYSARGRLRGRHRAEIEVTEIGDITSLGVSMRYPVIQAHVALSRLIEKLGATVGKLGDVMLARVHSAQRREAEARGFEARHTHEIGMGDNSPVRMTE